MTIDVCSYNYFCEHCKDEGIITTSDGKIQTCKYCLGKRRFMEYLDETMKTADETTREKMRIIKEYLPDYAVMAVMEADFLNMSPKFMEMLSNAFGVLPLR